MNREIEFRAWDKKQKRMLYGVSIGTIKVWDENAPLISHEFSYSEDCIFEQYTGLRDKNGKKIYEGDIVKTNSPDRANFNAGAIVMQQQMYLIINTPTYGDARLFHSEPLGYYCDIECEIIGNIHENPELLGGEE